MWKRRRPLTACGTASSTPCCLYLVCHRLPPSFGPAGLLRPTVEAQALCAMQSTSSCCFSFSTEWAAVGPESAARCPHFPYPQATASSFICARHPRSLRLHPANPEPAAVCLRDVGPSLLSDQWLFRLASPVLVQASFIYQNCATAVNIATDVSVPPSPGASYRRSSIDNSDRRVAVAGPRRWFSALSVAMIPVP
jgi:hypothetical protein